MVMLKRHTDSGDILMLEKRLQDLADKIMKPDFRLMDLSHSDAQVLENLSYDEILEHPPVSYSLQICFEPFSIKSTSLPPDEILRSLKLHVTDTDESRLYMVIATYILWLLQINHESYNSERVAKAIFDMSLLRTVKDYTLPLFAV